MEVESKHCKWHNGPNSFRIKLSQVISLAKLGPTAHNLGNASGPIIMLATFFLDNLKIELGSEIVK